MAGKPIHAKKAALQWQRGGITFSYSPTFACCPEILILRAYNYFMMPEVGMISAFFMGLSSWESVLIFDKQLFVGKEWHCQEKEWNAWRADWFLPGCSCPPRSADLEWHEETQSDPSSWDQKSQGSDSGTSFSLPETMVIACWVLDKNLGYYITCFRNILVGWEGCISSWPFLPGKPCSICGSDPTVLGQAYQVGQPCRSCCA